MHREDTVALGRQLLGYLESGTTYVSDHSARNPVSSYLDETQWRAEHTSVFRGQPVVVALSAELRQPGDWVTFQLPDLPVVVIRGEDGVARSFINACRHRGVHVCQEQSGHSRRLVCPFHAWTYDTSGRLDVIPDGEAVTDLDPSELGLAELETQELAGLVWLTPDNTDLAGYLGTDLVRELTDIGLVGHHHFRSTIVQVESNWKLMYDTFLEFYHGVYAHKATLAHLLERNLVHFDQVGEHWRMAAAKKSVRSLAETSEDKWDVLSHVVLSYDVFPNLAVNLHGDHTAVYRIVPDSQRPDRCYWHFSMLVPDKPETERSREYFDKNFDYIVGTGHEDVAMAEATQQTLASGANDSLVYSRYEPVLAWHHQRIANTADPSSRPD
jgi:phenylpropionate dioxygenase-like ring-hydroxylating dioxygenase large terminal subunit